MNSDPATSKRLFREFLARDHLITAGWAAVVGILGFVGGLSVDWLRGPDEVFVTNPPIGLDTVLVVHLDPPDTTGAILGRLEAIAREVEALRHRSAEVPPARVVVGTDTTVANLLYPNPVALPRFELPEEVEGYAVGRLGQFLSLDCPTDSVSQNKVVSILFRVLNDRVVPRATPVFVDVHRRRSERSVYLLFHEQYDIRSGWNRIDFVADFEPGSLELKIGFYLREEVNRKYPPFYQTVCPLTVHPST